MNKFSVLIKEYGGACSAFSGLLQCEDPGFVPLSHEIRGILSLDFKSIGASVLDLPDSVTVRSFYV